ncbi:MAG: aminotransferase class I/II-fold pyridoxal phosphate-dependent enzyme [Nibricoccus sp.]
MTISSGKDRFFSRIGTALNERVQNNLERVLTIRECNDALLDLAGNDYLGLAHDPLVVKAAAEALQRWGASSSASPLISGYTSEHAALERELCNWVGFPHGLVWNSGYSANGAVLGTLPQKGDVILADRLVHHSLLAGALHSGARLQRFAHNDLDALRRLLEMIDSEGKTIFVVTESVYSMDGDTPDLAGLAALKEKYGFIWVLDEAHAIGWYGAGLAARTGITQSVDVLVGTLGKALGSCGAFTVFHNPYLRRHFINFAGEFIYSTYLPPANAAAALAAIQRVKDLAKTSLSACQYLSIAWRESLRQIVPEVSQGDSPVIPIPLGSTERALRCGAFFKKQGIRVGTIRPPTVPNGSSRLRLSLRRGLGATELARVTEALKEGLA